MLAYLFLANGFEEIEAIAPIDILRRANINIQTVSISNTKEVTGAHGIIIHADLLFTGTHFSINEMLILPGGMPGTKNLDAHQGLKKILSEQSEKGGKIAAICAAPSILGKMGLLKGKEAICYPGFEEALSGVVISKSLVVKSGNIITAKGAGVAVEFALKIVEELKGKSESERIATAICQTAK
jgi:4-methyl-5(b-hydroxyethyl)-thiazole monophosphate biosynthesis